MRPITKSFKIDMQPLVPECWGHRGASATFPENTIASFEKAVRDGSEGIESDVHVTADNVIVMFHDPSLERTTDGKGLIKEQAYHGGIENVRTKAEPHQQIPTFKEVCDLLMKPENRHVKLNIDIKPDNNPERLFTLMRGIVESYPQFATDLSPRLILGLWHPMFLASALKHVPTLRRVHIGGSPSIARQYFWKHCDGFSMYFASLVGAEGQAFLDQARKDNKDVFVWTVNRKDEMIEATKWGVKAILTDRTSTLQGLRVSMEDDFASLRRDEVGIFFRWATWRYWMLPQFVIQTMWISQLEKRAGVSFKDSAKADNLFAIPLPTVTVVTEEDILKEKNGGYSSAESSASSSVNSSPATFSDASGPSSTGKATLDLDHLPPPVELPEPSIPLSTPVASAA